MKILKKVANWFEFILTGKGDIANEAIDEKLVDYSGQGRNERGE